MSTDLKANFEKAQKKVRIYKTDTTRTLPTDENVLARYANELVESYNAFVNYVSERYSGYSRLDQNKIDNAFEETHKKNLAECLEILHYEIDRPASLNAADTDTLRKIPTDSDTDESIDTEDDDRTNLTGPTDESSGNNKTSVEASGSHTQNLENNSKDTDLNKNPNNSLEPEKTIKTVKMTSKIEFHNLCTRTFTEVYNGDPSGLDSFVRKIESIEILCENNDHTAILIRNILANVKYRALDIMPKDPKTVDAITNVLKEKIKPEKSSIIEGRMMALKLDRTNFSDYTKKVEQLADKLKRSLIIEGMTQEKANELAVQKSIDLCKMNTKSTLVQSVLSSSKFDTPKEVVAKYILETQGEKTQNSNASSNVFYARSGNNHRNNFNRNNSNRNNFNGNNFNRNYSQRNDFRGNYRSNGNRNGNSNDYRGNSRNNSQNGHNSQANDSRGNYRNFNRQKNHRSFKCEQGNEQSPASGAAQNNNWRRERDSQSE